MKFIIGFLFLFLHINLHAEEVRVYFTNYPPFTFSKAHKNDGFVLKAVREISKRTGIEFKESLTQISEVPKLSESEIALFTVVQRNPERENQLNWVGQVLEDRSCFATLKEKPIIKTLEDAKSLGKVGASKGSSTEKYLHKNDFKNVELSTGHPGNIRKLYAGKIDAWMMGESVIMATAKLEGFDNSKLKCDGDFGRSKFWIAASKKMSPDLLKKIQTSFNEIEKEGLLTKWAAEYR